MKTLTREQLQSRKDAAVRFVDNVLDDSERASEIEDESLEDYADRRKIALANSRRNANMPGNGGSDPRTKQDLLDELDDLQAENAALQDQLDAVADIVAGGDDDVEDDDDQD